MYQIHSPSKTFKKLPAKDEMRLDQYRNHVEEISEAFDTTAPEYSLYYAAKEGYLEALMQLVSPFKKQRFVLVVGIGGSSLGLEAVHTALGEGEVQLGLVDMINPETITHYEELISQVKKVTDIVVCVVSKSGTTTETLANASVLLRILEAKFDTAIYKQTIFISDPGTELLKVGKKLGVTCVTTPKAIGGRFSVSTEAGLIPLLLLGHDVTQFLTGYIAASSTEHEAQAAEQARILYNYLKEKYRHYNFFAFTERLESLGRWYRQLVAESIGKAVTISGAPTTLGWVPTISTPVELHSIGQLYLSGFPGVFTDFVSIDDNGPDYKVGPTKIAPQLKKFTLEEVGTALYGGVVAAYKEIGLAHRATVLSEDIPYSVGLFMGMRIRETMYLCALLEVHAFDQPSVELYKQKTRNLLDL